MNEENFKVTTGFKSYISKPELTALAPNFLVKGSKNVLVDFAQRVISRNGYTLFGAAGTLGAIKSSYEWNTSTAKQFALRAYDQYLEFYWNSTWNTLLSGVVDPTIDFAKVWDNTEKIDVLLFVNGDTNTRKWSGGVTKIRDCPTPGITLRKQGVLSAVTTVAFVAGVAGVTAPTITDSAANFLNAGFAAGDKLYITGSTGNSRIFTIGSVVAGTVTLIMSDVLVSEASGAAITLHTGEPTWASSRFLTTTTRKITYLGVEYVYTGGEATDTLTGLTAFPVPTLGDPVWQTVQVLANPGAVPASFKQDFIGVQLNQVILGSTKSQEIYGSKGTDYTDFTLTSPRAPGDPFKVNMDNYTTCIVKIDNLDQTVSSLMFGGGTSEFFKLNFQMAQDNANELVRMIPLKTATGSGLISRGAITPIKNATAYISREPSLDTLGSIESLDGQTNVPISDWIKDDFDGYDFTGAHLKYWKRAIYVALPAHGLVLIYDLQRKLWQPPQTIPVSRFAIINDLLYGHSSITNESYQLFVGTNDNGNFIPQVARFAYNNGGKRDHLKNMSEYWSDGYITPNGELMMNQYFGFNGGTNVQQMSILGSDTDIVSAVDTAPLGNDPLGANPLGGSSSVATATLLGSGATMLRFWQLDTMKLVDYMEQFTEYVMNTLDGQFAIVAHGSNQWDAGTVPVSHKK